MRKENWPYARCSRWRHQQGFTLFEMLLTAVMIGVIGGTLASVFPMLVSLNRVEYELRQKRVNLAIATAIEEWAKVYGSGTVQLPPPFTGTANSVDYKLAILDPSATAGSSPELMEFIRRQGVKPDEVLQADGGTPYQRVYQQIANTMFEEVPLFGSSGPRVRLTYRGGVVYTSDCAVPCTDSFPGASATITDANRFTWQPADTDTGAAFVSTLSIERVKKTLLAERLRTLTTRMTAYVNTKTIESLPPDIAINHFPPNGPTAAAGSINVQGCLGGWYPLSVTQLAPLGLQASDYATTPWGGQIQYCRDYAPDGGAADAFPHYAALRINANLTSGADPSNIMCSSSTSNCSVILTF